MTPSPLFSYDGRLAFHGGKMSVSFSKLMPRVLGTHLSQLL